MSDRILYGYFRSSAAYRVRIALNLKGLVYRQETFDLRIGEQRQERFRQLNPQGLVPVLQDGEVLLTQSLAICEYLDEAYPELPRLMPSSPAARARVRALAQLIACDIHPLNNLRVLGYLETQLGAEPEQRSDWIHYWVSAGFGALEGQLAFHGGFCLEGEGPTLADICLLPQVFNARRFAVPLDPYPNIQRIAASLQQHPAFAAAHPSQQPDSQ